MSIVEYISSPAVKKGSELARKLGLLYSVSVESNEFSGHKGETRHPFPMVWSLFVDWNFFEQIELESDIGGLV